ncbi:hypothetical protein [Sphingomonas sp. KR3-1]|uniref:hypothetical protein n=1 Tax=Sphingomonas sp. KR3-1 TaxID=3156611 RepID=UPI0032B58189
MTWLADHVEAVAGAISALIALVALGATWLRQRQGELRRDDVHRWADEAIAALQAVRLLTAGTRMKITPEEERVRFVQLMFDTSILVERGRLFFRNARDGRHGIEKAAAYRGRRPEILDQLVLAHQIACGWGDASAEDRVRMGRVAEDAARTFVSLVQTEVGRQRTASADTRRRGKGADLQSRLAMLESGTA